MYVEEIFEPKNFFGDPHCNGIGNCGSEEAYNS